MFDVSADCEFVIDDDWVSIGFVIFGFYEIEFFLVAVEDAAGDDGDGAGEEDVIDESGAFVGRAVAIGVFENGDATDGFVFVFAIGI